MTSRLTIFDRPVRSNRKLTRLAVTFSQCFLENQGRGCDAGFLSDLPGSWIGLGGDWLLPLRISFD